MGSSSSSSTSYRKRDAEPSELSSLRTGIYNMVSPLTGSQPAGDSWNSSLFGKAWNSAQSGIDTANQLYKSFGDNVNSLSQNVSSAGTDASRNAAKLSSLGDGVSYDTSGIKRVSDILGDLAQKTSQTADSMSGNSSSMASLASKIAGTGDSQSGLSRTIQAFTESGNVPQALLDNLNKSVSSELQTNAADALNALASRGVLNSSVTNRSLDSLSNSAADAYAKNYLNAYNSVLSGYGQTNSALSSAADSYAKALSGYDTANKGLSDQIAGYSSAGDLYNRQLAGEQSVLDAAKQTTQDRLNAYKAAGDALSSLMSGYTNALNSNVSALNSAAEMPSKLTDSLTAQFSPVYDFWKDWQNSYDNREDYDTVVTSGGGK